ncbi:MAG TPA: hypothetical protein VL053_00415 [Arachidicoccus sp.]|nr:hypothetical protein [Arachidicoccus sp.]
MLKVTLTFISSLLCTLVFAQQKKFFYGRIFDSITELPVQDVHVSSSNQDTSDYTNRSGLFIMRAAPGDTLNILRVGYYQLKIALAGNALLMDTLHILLVPKTHELESVTVSAYNYADYQADSADRHKFFGASIGYAHPLFDRANTGAGLGISLDRIFGHKQRSKKRALRLFQSVEKEKYVDFRFNPILVHSYTGLKSDSLQQFMNKYRPSFDWLRAHPKQEDLLYYINSKMKKYFPGGR